MIARKFVHVAGVLLATALSSLGADFTWTNDTSANFSDNGAWLNGSPPGAGDTALFTNLPSHTVDVTANQVVKTERD